MTINPNEIKFVSISNSTATNQDTIVAVFSYRGWFLYIRALANLSDMELQVLKADRSKDIIYAMKFTFDAPRINTKSGGWSLDEIDEHIEDMKNLSAITKYMVNMDNVKALINKYKEN